MCRIGNQEMNFKGRIDILTDKEMESLIIALKYANNSTSPFKDRLIKSELKDICKEKISKLLNIFS